MTASISKLSLTLTQTREHRILGVVIVSYAYTLANTAEPGSKDPETPFNVEIDILGDDLIMDDLLAKSVDRHSIDCAVGATVQGTRTLTVAQSLLDEDIGDDEIKLILRVQRDSEALVEATTPIVKGKF